MSSFEILLQMGCSIIRNPLPLLGTNIIVALMVLAVCLTTRITQLISDKDWRFIAELLLFGVVGIVSILAEVFMLKHLM